MLARTREGRHRAKLLTLQCGRRRATNVFNKAAAFPALRFDALVAVIEYASATGLVNLVSSYFDAIDELLPAASLTAVQRRKLLLTVANVVEKEDASR